MRYETILLPFHKKFEGKRHFSYVSAPSTTCSSTPVTDFVFRNQVQPSIGRRAARVVSTELGTCRPIRRSRKSKSNSIPVKKRMIDAAAAFADPFGKKLRNCVKVSG